MQAQSNAATYLFATRPIVIESKYQRVRLTPAQSVQVGDRVTVVRDGRFRDACRDGVVQQVSLRRSVLVKYDGPIYYVEVPDASR